ncbi:right-handed parallel beta-helix repeat-containing protein, partial [Candidatus Bathyarchaeota archaeon]|nr:right-handed parallel beta-helix repeat-containing protein [Candidatus Bathyarchaeota archaeon]
MSGKLVLSAFISLFILTVLVSQIASSQSMANGQCVIPQSGTVNYPNAGVDLTLAETVHNLDSGLNYTTIQAAIDAVETLDGHTIFVEEGTYNEHLYIDKSLALFGDTIGTTVIDGNGASQVVDIKADNVDISNFLITNGRAGFYIRNSSNNRIWQNTITNTEKAIYIYGYVLSHFSSFNTILENTILNNTCGIDDGGVNTTIVGNTV